MSSTKVKKQNNITKRKSPYEHLMIKKKDVLWQNIDRFGTTIEIEFFSHVPIKAKKK